MKKNKFKSKKDDRPNSPFENRKKFCPFSQPGSPVIDYKDIRLLSRLGDQKITPGDLGLEFTEANRRGIRKYKFGVKTLERKLEPLYAQQKSYTTKLLKTEFLKV